MCVVARELLTMGAVGLDAQHVRPERVLAQRVRTVEQDVAAVPCLNTMLG